ncbi:MAG: nicotinate-nucleotide--dimethylbenzimidazole phosphoribosyltransferase [Sinobacteraceae bacterium]|nr:nicotinate-nucleotide--dimethylbenzimidazole phosphoribosyltransferase [Nevskiaceae bacterium]
MPHQATGSLGRLETLAPCWHWIQRREQPQLQRRNSWCVRSRSAAPLRKAYHHPTEVTRQMVLNIPAGGAAVSVLGPSAWHHRDRG